MLRIENFKKSYQNQVVLEIENLTIPHGIHWVKGSNGSGKSTFFRCLAGILPFEGTISLNDIDQRVSPVAYRSMVSYAEAEPMYPGFLSGMELIQYTAECRNVAQKDVEHLIELFGVSSFVENAAGSYSSGMLKKISLIMALIGDLKWIILDEPLVTIDVQTVKILEQKVEQLYQEKGISFLISSHQQFEDKNIKTTHEYLIRDTHIQLIK